MMVRHALNRQVRDVRQKGVGFTLRKLFRNHVFGRRTSLLLRGPANVTLSPALDRLCAPADLALFKDGDDWRFRRFLPEQVRTLPDLRNDGVRIWMLLDDDGHAIAYVCTIDRPYYDRHVYKTTYVPPPGGHYLFALMVAPQFRAYQGLGVRVMAGVLARLREDGPADGGLDCLTAVNDTNSASLRLIRLLGFRDTGTALRTSFLFGSTLGLTWSRQIPLAAPGPRPAAPTSHQETPR